MAFKTTGYPILSAEISILSRLLSCSPLGTLRPKADSSDFARCSLSNALVIGCLPCKIGGLCAPVLPPIKAAASMAQSASGRPHSGKISCSSILRAISSGIFSGTEATKAKGLPLERVAIIAASNTQSHAACEQRSARGKSTMIQPIAISPCIIAENAAPMPGPSPQI